MERNNWASQNSQGVVELRKKNLATTDNVPPLTSTTPPSNPTYILSFVECMAVRCKREVKNPSRRQNVTEQIPSFRVFTSVGWPTGWTYDKSPFDSRLAQECHLSCYLPSPAKWPTQHPLQCIRWAFRTFVIILRSGKIVFALTSL